MIDKNMTDLDKKDPKVYELGYLVVPFVAESEKDALVKKEIISVIEKNDGKIISELAPTMRRLAYSIRKMINNKYSIFTDAFFGSIKFETTPDMVEGINATLRKSDMVVRHLLIEAAKPALVKAKAPSVAPADTTVSEEPKEAETLSADELPTTGTIDKEIDDLLVA